MNKARANLLKYIVFTAVVIIVTGFASIAEARSCYTMKEAEAEQGIRIHSELMVIGLNCHHMARSADNKNLYTKYREFTNRHRGLFANYEETLIRYYSQESAGDPEATLNTLRTDFANKISNDAAQMRPDMFCKRYAPRISKVSGLSRETIQKWASTFYDSHPVSRPLCN